jgi:hypothetical protein
MTCNPVVVMTEQEIGGKFGTGAAAKEAKEFAAVLTNHLTAVGQRHEPIGRLLALYRLLDIALHLDRVARSPLPLPNFGMTHIPDISRDRLKHFGPSTEPRPTRIGHCVVHGGLP